MVGLYGDPDVTWSVVLALRLTTPRTAQEIVQAADALAAGHRHVGRVPRVVRFLPEEEADVLDVFANQAYGDHDPLVRVALSDDGCTLVLAAHHGVVDGLGLLGVAAVLLGEPLSSNARGIARETEPDGFVLSSLRRLAEVAFRPPVRVVGDLAGASPVLGDWLEARDVNAAHPGSAALVSAAVDLVREANGRADPGQVIVSMGLSRRPGTPVPSPHRDTAYARLPAGEVRSVDQARALMTATPPEPAFPVSDGGGLGPRVTRLLSHRLGATVLVSNLGLVDHPGVLRIRFWPVPTGPAGVCLGLASTSSATTLTLRARRGWFSDQASGRLADVAARCLLRAAGDASQ